MEYLHVKQSQITQHSFGMRLPLLRTWSSAPPAEVWSSRCTYICLCKTSFIMNAVDTCFSYVLLQHLEGNPPRIMNFVNAVVSIRCMVNRPWFSLSREIWASRGPGRPWFSARSLPYWLFQSLTEVFAGFGPVSRWFWVIAKLVKTWLTSHVRNVWILTAQNCSTVLCVWP